MRLLVTGAHCLGKLDACEESVKIMNNTELQLAREKEDREMTSRGPCSTILGEEKKRQVKSPRPGTESRQGASGTEEARGGELGGNR